MSDGALLFTYRAVAIAFGPFSQALLAWRLRHGKEDRARLAERIGLASQPRPRGRLAWMHGASVGEGLALLPLVERLVARGFHVLVTTGTVTSAGVLGMRLPPGAMHQFVPIDIPRFLRRFLDHWQPDLTLLAESELWPNLLVEIASRDIPLVLVNARLSQRSFQRWQKVPSLIRSLLGRIDLCLAQSQEDAIRLQRLGAPHVRTAGNLKYDVPSPPVDAKQLGELTAAVGARPVWLAASTHPGEDEIIVDVHRQLAAVIPSLFTIIAPRHPARGAAIAEIARQHGILAAVRSRGEPITSRTQIYVADTMGELGLFYRLAGVVFVGKSLAGLGGGQNPIEAAKLGAAVLHGPHIANFIDVYRELDRSKGSAVVGDGATLARALAMLLSDPALLRKMARAASEAVEQLGGATDNIVKALEPYFMQMQLERR